MAKKVPQTEPEPWSPEEEARLTRIWTGGAKTEEEKLARYDLMDEGLPSWLGKVRSEVAAMVLASQKAKRAKEAKEPAKPKPPSSMRGR